MAKKKTKKAKKTVTPGIPKGLRSSIIRKFKSKDRTTRLVVTRLPYDGGFAVQAFSSKSSLSVIRNFTGGKSSVLPTPIRTSVELELAIWYARTIARNGVAPSVKRERSRRRRYIKRQLASFKAHTATKQVVSELQGVPPPSKLKRPQILLPYICMYDPKAGKEEPVFYVHTAYCPLLDQQRKRLVKRGGTSWVIEAVTAAGAVALQLAEFNEDDKGYDRDDFKIHGCGSGERILRAKKERRVRDVESKEVAPQNARQSTEGGSGNDNGLHPRSEGDSAQQERGYLLKSEIGASGG